MEREPRLSTWTHPTTGAVRIYVNDWFSWNGQKVWFERHDEFIDLRYKGADPSMLTDNGRGEAFDMILDHFGISQKLSWDELWNALIEKAQ